MVKGLIGLENLSGPITIAKVAGQSAEMGWQTFISFMALMSVSLGILNLLPIQCLMVDISFITLLKLFVGSLFLNKYKCLV